MISHISDIMILRKFSPCTDSYMRNDLYCSVIDSGKLNLFEGAVNCWLLSWFLHQLLNFLWDYCDNIVNIVFFLLGQGITHINNNLVTTNTNNNGDSARSETANGASQLTIAVTSTCRLADLWKTLWHGRLNSLWISQSIDV